MICKHCSTENADSAVFCKNCGKRLDGKKVCPKCNALIEEDAVWCTNCGTRVDGKKVCANCGTVYDGNFCHACGRSDRAPLRTRNFSNYNNQTSGLSHKPLIPTELLNRIGLYIGLAGAAFAFIFMFFMGCGFTVKGTELDEMQSLLEINIFDCFSSKYINKWRQLSTGEDAIALVPIMQMIFASATLICTTTFFALAVYRFVNSLLGKQTKSIENMIFGTLISYLVGALCFKSMFYYSWSYKNELIKYGFTGATNFGIWLSIICWLWMMICNFTQKRKTLQGNALFKAYSSYIIMFVSLVLLFCLTGQFSIKEEKVSQSFGFTFMIIAEAMFEDSAALAVIGYIITLLIIAILATIVVYSAIHTIIEEEKSLKGIIFAGIAFGLSVLFLILSIAAKYSNELFEEELSINALPYCLCIFTLAILITEIVYKKRPIEHVISYN